MIKFAKNTKYMEFDRDELQCIYRNCKHKNKEHDGKICKCKHITNEILGIGFQPTAIIMWDKEEK